MFVHIMQWYKKLYKNSKNQKNLFYFIYLKKKKKIYFSPLGKIFKVFLKRPHAQAPYVIRVSRIWHRGNKRRIILQILWAMSSSRPFRAYKEGRRHHECFHL